MASICRVATKDGGVWLRGPPQNQRCSATAELTSANFAKKMLLLHMNGLSRPWLPFQKPRVGRRRVAKVPRFFLRICCDMSCT